MPENDLSGTRIDADQPIAVFVGHECADVPFNRTRCDHLEEQLIPREALGTRYVISRTEPQLPAREPNLLRFVSNRPDNTLRFTPASAHPPVVLQQGETFELLQDDNLIVEGTGPFLTLQFLVGMDYFGIASASASAADPSMVLEAPEASWRASYVFTLPPTFRRSFVNAVVPVGSGLLMGCP